MPFAGVTNPNQIPMTKYSNFPFVPWCRGGESLVVGLAWRVGGNTGLKPVAKRCSPASVSLW